MQIKLEYILIVIIVLFGLHLLMDNCNCERFSVGGEEDTRETCQYFWESIKCPPGKKKFDQNIYNKYYNWDLEDNCCEHILEEKVLPTLTKEEVKILQGGRIDLKKSLDLTNKNLISIKLVGKKDKLAPAAAKRKHIYIHLIGLDFSGSDFSLDLSHKFTQIAYVDFTAAILTNTNFSMHGEVEEGDKRRPPILTELNFDYANLKGSNFSNRYLYDCDFSNASLTMANFSNTEIKFNNFSGIKAQEINFMYSKIHGDITFNGHIVRSYIDFKGAILTDANFIDADLRAIDFTGANLRMADFRNARLVHIIFDNADLTGANFEGAILDSNIFSNATLTLARLVDIIDIDSKVMLHRPVDSTGAIANELALIDIKSRDQLTERARNPNETEQIIRSSNSILGTKGLSLTVFTNSDPEVKFANKLGNLMLRSDIFLEPAAPDWKPDDDGNYPNYEGRILAREVDTLPEGVGAKDKFNEIILENTTDDKEKSEELQELAIGVYESFNSIIKFRESDLINIEVFEVEHRLLEMMETLI